MATRDIRIRYGLDVDRASFQAGEQAMQRIADSTGQTVDNVRAVEQEMNRELGIIEKLRQKELELARARDLSHDPDEIKKYNQQISIVHRQLNQLTGATVTQTRAIEKLRQRELELASARDRSNNQDEIKRYNEELERTRREIDRISSGTSTAAPKMSGMWAKLGGMIGGALSVAAVGAFIKGGVDLAAQMESTRISFEQFTGSALAAKTMLAEIEAFAAKTPFQFPELAGAAKNMLSFGIAQEKVMPALKALGDVSAGTGASIEELSAIYGKAAVRGKIDTEIAMQFVERGIPLYAELAKQFGVTTDEVGKLIETGKVGFPNIEQAFKNMTKEGGFFFNLMEKQSTSTSGKISTLKDNFGRLQRQIGEALLPVVNDAIDAFGGFLEELGFAGKGFDSMTDSVFAGSKALEKQKFELNALVPLLKDTSLSEATRAEVLRKINEINPDVTKGMTLQNIEYSKLDENLKAVNIRMTEQIELLKKKETVEFVSTKAAEARNKQIEAEIFLAGLIRENLTDQELLSKDLTEQIEIVAAEIDKLGFRGLSEGNFERFFKIVMEKRADAIAQQADLNKILTQAQKELNAATEIGTVEETKATETKVNSIKTLKEEIAAKKTLLETLDVEGAEYRKLDKEISAMEARLRSLTETHKNYTKAIKETSKARDDWRTDIPDELTPRPITIPIEFDAPPLPTPDFEPYISEINDLQAKIRKINDATAGEGAQTLRERYSAAWEDIMADGEATFSELVPLMQEITEKLAAPALQVTGAISDFQEAAFNRQLSALDKAKEKELSNQRLTAEGRAKIEADYQIKREALELKAAQRRKQIALVEATIQGALAVIKVIENPFLAIITAAAVAANIAAIASQQFAKGGYTGDGEKMEPAGIVHKGEFVIDKATTAKMGLRGKTMREFTEMVQPMILQQPAWSFNQATANLSPELMQELKGLRRDLKALPVNVTVLNEQGFLHYAASMRTWKFHLNKSYYA